MKDETRQISAQLDPEQQDELKEVKEYYGVKNDAEAIRFLIRKEARQLRFQPALPLPGIMDVHTEPSR